MCAVYTLRPVPFRGAHRSIVAQHNVSRNTLSTGTWCSGITPAQNAGGPGFNPQCVHIYHCRVRMTLWNPLAALSVQGTTSNMQCAMCCVQSAMGGVRCSSLQCVRCIHSALSPFEGLITVLSRKTM